MDPEVANLLSVLAETLHGTTDTLEWDSQPTPDGWLGERGLHPTDTFGEAGPSVVGRFEGRPASVEIEPLGELVIKVRCGAAVWLRLVLNRLAARLDVFGGPRVLTGVYSLDQAFVLRGAPAEPLRRWLAAAATRPALEGIQPFVSLRHERTLLTLRAPVQSERLSASVVVGALAHVCALAAALESLAPSPSPPMAPGDGVVGSEAEPR